jgi:SAM-dependent methyltransferase
MAALRPCTLVELGTHKGDSYMAFCQAAAAFDLDTKCFAVDNWTGDVHIGEMPEQVYGDVKAANARYAAFSTLVRADFTEAADRFAEGSIDLLHIDGTHTYEAVARDVRTWLPKLSRRGVVLMHDIAVKLPDFGVHKIWDELAATHPHHLAFHHSAGLGVVAIGDDVPHAFLALLSAPPERKRLIVDFFARLGDGLSAEIDRPEDIARVRAVSTNPDASSSPSPFAVFADRTDDEWIRTIERSRREPVIAGVRFPAFPSTGNVSAGSDGVVRESGAFFRAVRSACETAGRPLGRRSKILDFGMGWGLQLRFFLRDTDGDCLHGVDPSAEDIKLAKALGCPGHLAQINPRGRLAYGDQGLDVVYACQTLSQMPPELHEHWLPEIARVLRPGSLFVATVLAPRFIEGLAASGPTRLPGPIAALAREVHARPSVSAQLDRSGIVHLSAGGSRATVLTPDHVRRRWSRWFDAVDVADDPAHPSSLLVTARTSRPGSRERP